MKKLLIIIIALITMSCEQENKKLIKVIDNSRSIEQAKDILLISKKEYNNIQSLSPAARDVAIYFITNKDKWITSSYTFKCDEFEIWIANGYRSVKIYNPVLYELNKKEKDFFWNMYKTYQRKDMRLYRYESEIEIRFKNKKYREFLIDKGYLVTGINTSKFRRGEILAAGDCGELVKATSKNIYNTIGIVVGKDSLRVFNYDEWHRLVD